MQETLVVTLPSSGSPVEFFVLDVRFVSRSLTLYGWFGVGFFVRGEWVYVFIAPSQDPILIAKCSV